MSRITVPINPESDSDDSGDEGGSVVIAGGGHDDEDDRNSNKSNKVGSKLSSLGSKIGNVIGGHKTGSAVVGSSVGGGGSKVGSSVVAAGSGGSSVVGSSVVGSSVVVGGNSGNVGNFSSAQATPQSSSNQSSSSSVLFPTYTPPSGSSRKKVSDSFIAASTNSGDKAGFVFKDGVLGKGYYRDVGKKPLPVAPVAQPAATSDTPLSGKDLYALLRSKEKEERQNTQHVIPASDDDDEEDRTASVTSSSTSKSVLSNFGRIVGNKISAVSKKTSHTESPPLVPLTNPNIVPFQVPKRIAPTVQTGTPQRPLPQVPGPTLPEIPHNPLPKLSLDVNPQPPVTTSQSPVRVVPSQPQPPIPQLQPQTPVVVQPQTQKPAQAAPVVVKLRTGKNNDQKLEQVLDQVGLDLPETTIPSTTSRVLRTGNMIFTSAHGPQLPNGIVRGRLGDNFSMDQAQIAAGLAAVSVLKSVKEELNGSLDTINKVIRIEAQVACDNPTVDLYEVFEIVAYIFKNTFGSTGSLVVSGVRSLPDEAMLQVSVIFEVIN